MLVDQGGLDRLGLLTQERQALLPDTDHVVYAILPSQDIHQPEVELRQIEGWASHLAP